MNPQKLSQLDPKLREAYERVMGTNIPTTSATTIQAQTPPPPPTSNPIPQPQPQPIQPPVSMPQPSTLPIQPITEPQPVINPQPIPTPEPVTAPQPTTNFVQMNSEVPAAPTANANFTMPVQTKTAVLKKNNGIMPILFLFVGIIFLLIYSLFWAKIFNLSLPFLP